MFFIQEGDERNEAAFIAVYFLFAFASFIRKGDVQTFIQKASSRRRVFNVLKS